MKKIALMVMMALVSLSISAQGNDVYQFSKKNKKEKKELVKELTPLYEDEFERDVKEFYELICDLYRDTVNVLAQNGDSYSLREIRRKIIYSYRVPYSKDGYENVKAFFDSIEQKSDSIEKTKRRPRITIDIPLEQIR